MTDQELVAAVESRLKGGASAEQIVDDEELWPEIEKRLYQSVYEYVSVPITVAGPNGPEERHREVMANTLYCVLRDGDGIPRYVLRLCYATDHDRTCSIEDADAWASRYDLYSWDRELDPWEDEKWSCQTTIGGHMVVLGEYIIDGDASEGGLAWTPISEELKEELHTEELLDRVHEHWEDCMRQLWREIRGLPPDPPDQHELDMLFSEYRSDHCTAADEDAGEISDASLAQMLETNAVQRDTDFNMTESPSVLAELFGDGDPAESEDAYGDGYLPLGELEEPPSRYECEHGNGSALSGSDLAGDYDMLDPPYVERFDDPFADD